MKVTRAGVDRSANYLPEELSAIQIRLTAWDGEVGLGSMPIPDPAGNQEPYEGESLLLEQGAVTILDGFVGGVTNQRGVTSVGPRQSPIYAIGDDNALLHGHATTGWTRPAEAPAARWAAFVDAFLPGSIDTTWLLTTNESGITLPKKTYRTDSLFDELISDTQVPTAKSAYIEHRRFHWHLATEGQVCSLALSDTGFDDVTTLSIREPQRVKDALDLRNELYGRNEAGAIVSVSDATSITRHNAGGLKHQGLEQYSGESAARMTADLTIKLAERKAERITYRGEVGPLTAAQVDQLIPGSLINVTSDVWRLTSSTQRIAAISWAYRVSPDGRHYTGAIELGYPTRIRRKPPKTSAAKGPFDASQSQHWYFGTFTFAITSAFGGGVGIASMEPGPATAVTLYSDNLDGATFIAGDTYDYAVGMIVGPYDYGPRIGLAEHPRYPIGAVGSGRIWDVSAFGAAGSFTLPAGGGPYLVHCVAELAKGAPFGGPPTADHTANVTYWFDPAGWVPPVPASGQAVEKDVPDEVPDGVITDFTIAHGGNWEMVPGTLRVRVNGVYRSDVTETSATGYSFVYPLLPGAEVVAEYVAP